VPRSRPGELDGVDRVVLVRGRRDVEPVLVLGPVVATSGESPGPAGGGLELGEVQLPDLVRPRRLDCERRLPTFGKRAPFALVLVSQDQAPVSQPAQHRRLGYDVALVAHHRPDLAVAPDRVRQGVLVDQLRRGIPGGSRPRALRRPLATGLGLPPAPRAFRDVEGSCTTSRSTSQTRV
jgi:hypothetical protein